MLNFITLFYILLFIKHSALVSILQIQKKKIMQKLYSSEYCMYH